MAKIQIFSVLGKNGVMFARFLRETMSKLSSGNHELSFNCFMSSRAVPSKGWEVLEYILKQKHTSLNHTTGLNRVLDYVDGDYVVCSDTDVAMLIPNWDDILVKKIDDNNLDILGIDHWDNPRGYQGFPIVTFFMSKSSSYLQAAPDFRPIFHAYPNKRGIGVKEKQIETNIDAQVYGLPIGSPILLDSGWQLPTRFKELNMKSGVLDKKINNSISHVPQCWSIDDDPIVGHKGKGSKRRQSLAKNFFAGSREYIKNRYGIKL